MPAYTRAAVLVAALAAQAAPPAAGSTCYGTTSNGALKDGCKLPSSGANFSSYTVLGGLLGRTWVHCNVAEVIEESYAALHASHADRQFMTAETGRKEGGPLSHHKTHQNGLSVDFMVPVKDRSGASVPLPALQGLQFSSRRAWVRHDEHYHVDFAIPCEPMAKRPRGPG